MNNIALQLYYLLDTVNILWIHHLPLNTSPLDRLGTYSYHLCNGIRFFEVRLKVHCFQLKQTEGSPKTYKQQSYISSDTS